jgi:hypothetical protein
VNHQADHRRGAADLARNVDAPPTARMKSERELLLLVSENARHGDAPVIE